MIACYVHKIEGECKLKYKLTYEYIDSIGSLETTAIFVETLYQLLNIAQFFPATPQVVAPLNWNSIST